MPPGFEYDTIEDAPFDGALLVAAFPTAGFVSQVAARHLVQSQGLQLAGAFRSDELPPAISVEGGVPLPPLRVYVGQQVCGLDQDCDALAVLLGDMAPPEALRTPLARATLDWAERAGVGCVVAIESIPQKDDEEQEPVIRCVSASKASRDRLAKQGVEPLDGVLVSGMTAALLAESAGRDLEVTGLFVEAHASYRDARAAARLVEVIDNLLLHIPIDAAPLRQLAEELTHQVRNVADRTQAAFPYLSMYG